VTLFKPCIDLHLGSVKQIVGSTLGGNLRADESNLVVNFESDQSAADYARLYAADNLLGGHVIMLGPKNEDSAIAALKAYPGGLQLGGGVTPENAQSWIDYGASHIIVTSCLFDARGDFVPNKLEQLVNSVGKDKIVIDLSCQAKGDAWVVMMDRWQKETNLRINQENLNFLSKYCDEFLIHATDLEGNCEGIDLALVEFLGFNCPIKSTYAGGVNSLADLGAVKKASGGRVDLTIGSALDIFGGSLVKYKDCVEWNKLN